MFAPSVATPQTKARTNPTCGLAQRVRSRTAQPDRRVEQALLLQRKTGNQAALRLQTQRPRRMTAQASPDSGTPHTAGHPQITRTCAACKDEAHRVQPMSAHAQQAATAAAPDLVHHVLGTPGKPLDAASRAFFEPRLGRDLSRVRVHIDQKAAESAEAVDARAYAVGPHIAFAAGQFAPSSEVGRRLIAHELVHVVQQTGGAPTALRRTHTDDSGRQLFDCPDFVGDPKLEACLNDKDRLRPGDRGLTVMNVQHALLEDGADLGPTGADGRFGPLTAQAVMDFKQKYSLGSEQFPDVGPATMAKLDALCEPCPNGVVTTVQDPLPPVPPFQFQILTAEQVFDKVKQMQPSGQPLPANPPLGASQPDFPINPVKVSALPVPGSSCVKCAAQWDLSATWISLIATGPIDSNEPARLAAFQQDNVSGCPFQPLPVLLPVRRMVTPAAVPLIVAAEKEHYEDFVRAFQMVGGRYQSNVQRLTPERTHLRARDLAECEDKVLDFLFDARGQYLHFFLPFLERYSRSFGRDFQVQYNLPNRDRRDGPHQAIPSPPTSPKFEKPIFPNVDLDINPFGCKAFFRLYGSHCIGPLGPPSDTIIKDTNEPLRQPWHVL